MRLQQWLRTKVRKMRKMVSERLRNSRKVKAAIRVQLRVEKGAL
jgi:hypothetical protein